MRVLESFKHRFTNVQIAVTDAQIDYIRIHVHRPRKMEAGTFFLLCPVLTISRCISRRPLSPRLSQLAEPQAGMIFKMAERWQAGYPASHIDILKPPASGQPASQDAFDMKKRKQASRDIGVYRVPEHFCREKEKASWPRYRGETRSRKLLT